LAYTTHSWARSAILFLYREVLGIELPWLDDLQRPSRARRIPAVPSPEEVARLLGAMEGVIQLVARLL
jgi:hypothetical protein